jgi:hypothetical protein
VKDDFVPVFESGHVSPAELVARVRRRLREQGHPPVATSADPSFDLSRPDGLIDGWYEPEVFDGTTVRWTNRRFDFEAEVRDATHVAIEAALFPESGFAEVRARLRANDVPGAPFRLRTGWNSRLTPIPAGVTGRVHFSIDAGGSWSPAGLGLSGDSRELAILVRRLALVPFVRLPRFAAPPSPAPSASLLARIVRKLRRLLLGSELARKLQQVDDLAELERRLNETAGILEDRLLQLALVQAESAADALEREEEWQEELARKLLHFSGR